MLRSPLADEGFGLRQLEAQTHPSGSAAPFLLFRQIGNGPDREPSYANSSLSLRVFVVEAGTPSVPTLQVVLVAGVVALLVLRQWVGIRNGAGVLKF